LVEASRTACKSDSFWQNYASVAVGMKLIAGLGNPGRRYAGTRHNVGFEVVGRLERRWGADSRVVRKFDGQWMQCRVGDQAVGLLRPLTYMNFSGHCLRAAIDFYKIELADVLVVSDDFQLLLGRIRLRRGGSAGGQKGLDHVIAVLGTDAVPRLRIGIGPVPPEWNAVDFVLSRFAETEREPIEKVLDRAADAAECWVERGIEAAMGIYNAADEAG
jgi:PTH1 family peptidyl-tRNA hydrolase